MSFTPRSKSFVEESDKPKFVGHESMIKQSKNLSVWNWRIVRRAIVDALLKLNPRAMMKNPVMFVVEVGSLLTTIQFKIGRASCRERV